MYRYFIGKAEEFMTNSIVLEVNNIGYEIFVGDNDITAIRALSGDIKVYTYTYVREDSMLLFGFLKKSDLEIFNKLIDVNGIGAKTAIAIIGTLGADKLVEALENDDIAALTKCQGIGKKTAQRMILELRGKLILEEKINQNFTSKPDNANEAISALEALGFSKGNILDVFKYIEFTDDLSSEDIIKRALKYM